MIDGEAAGAGQQRRFTGIFPGIRVYAATMATIWPLANERMMS